MNISENKKSEILVIIVCLCLLLPLVLVGMYNFPSADDFGYSVLTRQAVENGGGIIEVIKAAWQTNINYYNSWQGLYTSAFLLALQPGIWGEGLYVLTTPVMLAIAFFSLWGAAQIFNRHFMQRSKLYSAAIALVMTTAVMMWLPSAYGGLYWYNGAMNYMPYAFTNVLNLALLFDVYKTDSKKHRIVLIVLSTLLSFITSGGNHVTAFANILLLGIALLLCLPKKRFYPLVPLAAACIGFVIMFTAPGTAIRQSAFEAPGVVKTVVMTALHVHGLAYEWFSIKWLISLVAITPFALEFSHKNKQLFSGRYYPLFVLFCIVCSVAVICGMFCVPYYAMGGFGLGRVTNVIWITFMFLSWFCYVLIVAFFVAKGYLDTAKMFGEKHYQNIKTLVICAAMAGLFVIFENGLACTSLKATSELLHGIPQAYAREMDVRAQLYNDDSLTEVYVKPIEHKSEFLFSVELQPDPDQFPNSSMGRYYGKDIYMIEE